MVSAQGGIGRHGWGHAGPSHPPSTARRNLYFREARLCPRRRAGVGGTADIGAGLNPDLGSDEQD